MVRQHRLPIEGGAGGVRQHACHAWAGASTARRTIENFSVLSIVLHVACLGRGSDCPGAGPKPTRGRNRPRAVVGGRGPCFILPGRRAATRRRNRPRAGNAAPVSGTETGQTARARRRETRIGRAGGRTRVAKEADRAWRSAARRLMKGHGHEKRLKGGGGGFPSHYPAPVVSLINN